MRAGLWGGKKVPVGFQEERNLFVMPLAEEIGLTNGFLGEIGFKGGSGGQRQIKGQEQTEEDAREMTHGGNLEGSIEQKRIAPIEGSEGITQRARGCHGAHREEKSAQVVEIERDDDLL